MEFTIKKKLLSLFLFSTYISSNFATLVSSSKNKTVTKDPTSHMAGKISNKTFPGEGYEVYIVNKLPDNKLPLLIHCASKDDELGNHVLHVSDDFHWHFRMNYVLRTLFFCRFRWGEKDRSYDVFNKQIAPNCEAYNEKRDGNLCVWHVKEDGFWIGNQLPPKTLVQLYEW